MLLSTSWSSRVFVPAAALIALGVSAPASASTVTPARTPTSTTIHRSALLPATHSYAVLHNFTGTDGTGPVGNLAQRYDGSIWGETSGGGAFARGTVFKFTPGSGSVTFNFSFQFNAQGQTPTGGLIQSSVNNALYGVTQNSGQLGFGTFFRVNESGVTPLHQFNGAQGANPAGQPVEDAACNLYGVTTTGGTTQHGIIYRITPGGAFAVLHQFNGTDGDQPTAGLTMGPGGVLYGFTTSGGAHGFGEIYKITTSGVFTPLYSFTGLSDGANPQDKPVFDNAGNLYGTAVSGGAGNGGTVFRFSSGGGFTVLHPFVTDASGNYTNGAFPSGALVYEASTGTLFGTAFGGGGPDNFGVLFSLTGPGNLTYNVLHNFNGSDGANPVGGLFLSKVDHLIYGTTSFGGSNNDGVAFRF